MTRRLQNWLKSYLNYTRDSESPTTFHFWTGVSVLAGALRRRVWLDMKKFQWTPNFYIVLVGPPGIAAKSTSISMGMTLLSKVPGVKFGPESMTWQALGKDLEESTEHVDFTDINGKKALATMSCLTIPITELGTFLHPDDDQLMSILIRLWEGQVDTFKHKTKSSGNVEIPNPWLNIIAATTPAWLKENFPEGMIGGGLTSRIVFVYGDKKRGLIPYPDEVIPATDYLKMRDDLITDLTDISKMKGEFQLSQFAREWGRAWYADHNNPDLRPDHLSNDRYGGYIARKQTHLHKLAVVLAAARREKLTIEEDDLREAEAIISDNEKDMLKVFDSIGLPTQSKHIQELVSTVRFAGFLTNRGLWARCMNYMSYRDFEDAVRAGVAARVLEITSVNGVQGIVCPTSAKKGTSSP